MQSTSCPLPGIYPDMDQVKLGLGEGQAAALYTCSALVFVINISMFIFLIIKFIKDVPARQVPSMCWVSSLPTGMAFAQCLMIFLPKASEFLLLTFGVYEAVVIYKFVDLNLKWFGGEKELLRSAGSSPVMRFNVPPCCCVLLCLRKTLLTRKKLKFVRLMVSQMLYIQIFVLFMQQVLHYHESVPDGLLSEKNPNTFLKFVGKASFFAGFWGLFIFFTIDSTFNLLEESGKYKLKFFLMKLPLIVFITQETIMEFVISTGSISCNAHMSTSAMGNIVLASLIMVESLLLGVGYTVVYFRYPKIEAKYVESYDQVRV